MNRRKLLVLVAGACLTTSCITPTLPLPPPSAPEIEQLGTGQYRLTGTIPTPGTVLVQDTRSNLVFGKVVADFYQLPVLAEPGDHMILWYESGSERSDGVMFRIPALPEAVDAGTDAGHDAAVTVDAGRD